MKSPLHYQLSEYDCGPTSMLNAINYLFEREDIPPEVIRNIMLYSLDCYGAEGMPGKNGTSCIAMMFLSNWLCGAGKAGVLPVYSSYITGKSVYIGENGLICDTLHRGGVVILRLYYDVPHYVLLLGEQDDNILMFDPYYRAKPFPEKDILIKLDNPFGHNRIVPMAYFNKETQEVYALGDPDNREAVLLYNEKTEITAEKTIEYYI